MAWTPKSLLQVLNLIFGLFTILTFSFAVVLCIANIADLRSGENLAFMKVLNENTNTSFFLGIEGMTALPKY